MAEQMRATMVTQPQTMNQQQRETLVNQNLANFRQQLNMPEYVLQYGGMTQQQFNTLQPSQQDDIRRHMHRQQQAQMAISQQQQQQQHQMRQQDADRQMTFASAVNNGQPATSPII